MGTQSQDTAWQPILTGEPAERAREAIEAVAERLHTVPADWIPEGLPRLYRGGAANNPSLAGGRAGLAVFHAYLAEAWSRKANQERALQCLEEAIDLMAGSTTPPSLYAGFTGVAWATQHLRGRLLDPDAEDPNEDIDEALLSYLDRSPWPADYDLVQGLVGLGVYALERLPRKSAVECLRRIVDRLDETAERNAAGITWLTPPELLPPHQRGQAPRGHYNVGVAHGVPGVIALLGEVCAAGVAREKARPLLDGAVSWLSAQKLPGEARSRFPYVLAADMPPEPARSAWCYGDPGIAVTLLRAARCVGQPVWEREALEVARLAARRPPEDSGVLDAGVCHGAAGLGHVFNRMYQASGKDELRDAARFWFERTLELRRPGEGIGGFSAWMAATDGEKGWVADPHFLTGAAGIGLTLLAATTRLEPAWDRLLLVSVPPRAA